jgi:hypothetical protein
MRQVTVRLIIRYLVIIQKAPVLNDAHADRPETLHDLIVGVKAKND